jgi:hypothetical protein
LRQHRHDFQALNGIMVRTGQSLNLRRHAQRFVSVPGGLELRKRILVNLASKHHSFRTASPLSNSLNHGWNQRRVYGIGNRPSKVLQYMLLGWDSVLPRQHVACLFSRQGRKVQGQRLRLGSIYIQNPFPEAAALNFESLFLHEMHTIVYKTRLNRL